MSRVGQPLPGVTGPLLAFNGKDHIEGVSRIPYLDGGKWFVFSRAQRGLDGLAGLLFMRMSDDVPQTHEALLTSNPALRSDQSVRFMKTIEGTDHAGGLQVIGDLIVVASWCSDHDVCDNAMVDFFRARECESAGLCVDHINRFESGEHGRRRVDSDKGNFVATARMNNGHYILLLNRKNVGLTDIFVSSKTFIDATTTWSLLERDTFWADGYENGGDTYQNMNFVTECGTQKIFAIGLSQDSDEGANEVDLFEADLEGQ